MEKVPMEISLGRINKKADIGQPPETQIIAEQLEHLAEVAQALHQRCAEIQTTLSGREMGGGEEDKTPPPPPPGFFDACKARLNQIEAIIQHAKTTLDDIAV